MLSHCNRVGMTFVNCKLNGKLTEVMRKGVFLLAISYALLVSCSSAVSLADNYAEDENTTTLLYPHHGLRVLL